MVACWSWTVKVRVRLLLFSFQLQIEKQMNIVARQIWSVKSASLFNPLDLIIFAKMMDSKIINSMRIANATVFSIKESLSSQNPFCVYGWLQDCKARLKKPLRRLCVDCDMGNIIVSYC